jgi:hypothetical protein
MPTTNLDVKLERERRKTALAIAGKQVLLDLIKSPAAEIVAAYLVIEYAQKRQWIPSQAGTIAEGGVLAAVACKALAPILPTLTEGAASIMKALGPLAAIV